MMKKGLFSLVRNSEFEGENRIGAFSRVYDSSFGYMSYCGANCILVNVSVGKFCSIAGDVKNLFGRHPSSGWISTHPSFYSTNVNPSFVQEQLFEEYVVNSGSGKYADIGNDVWIASGVRIMDGVTIGNGAVVAAGSIVTKDVAPYSIVAGAPAKEIKKRFDQESIDLLIKSEWWNRDIDWIRRNAASFRSIERFRKLIGGE